MVAINDVGITSIPMLHELMTRKDHVLPNVHSRFVTLQKLLDIRDKKVWALMRHEVYWYQ